MPSPSSAIPRIGYRPEQLGDRVGDKGFGYASLAYAQAAFTEAYGGFHLTIQTGPAA